MLVPRGGLPQSLRELVLGRKAQSLAGRRRFAEPSGRQKFPHLVPVEDLRPSYHSTHGAIEGSRDLQEGLRDRNPYPHSSYGLRHEGQDVGQKWESASAI